MNEAAWGELSNMQPAAMPDSGHGGPHLRLYGMSIRLAHGPGYGEDGFPFLGKDKNSPASPGTPGCWQVER